MIDDFPDPEADSTRRLRILDHVRDLHDAGRLPLVAGYFMLRWNRSTAEVPAWVYQCDHEPGNPENKLDRSPRSSPYWVAIIGGRNVDPLDVLRHRDMRRISRREYLGQVADI